jgi:glycosyltransferase involved in cell wall biosynthesis
MVRVVVFVNELTSTSIPVEIAARTHTETDAEILLVSHYDGPGDDLDPDVADLDVPTVRLDGSRRLDRRAYRQLRALCRRQEIEVLHTHHNAVGSLGRLATAGAGVAVVNTEHNDHRFFSYAQNLVNAVSFPLVDVLVSNSESTRRSLSWYERLPAAGTRHEVVYNGIDSARIDAADPPDVALPEEPFVVAVGRLIEQKNYATLLDAFQTVRTEWPAASLVIVGDGPLADPLQRRASARGLDDAVTFTGYLPRREDVYGVLKQATVAAFPSLYEGFCVAAVEAMAAGLPVVASDIDVLREVVGDPGVFVEPENAGALADALVGVLEDPERRERLAANARKRARTTFSLDRTAREYCKIYKQVAESSGQ